MGPTTKAFLIFAAFVVSVAGLKAASEIVVPFLLAAFIATIAAAPMFWLERHRVPDWLAILLVMLGMITVVVGLGLIVVQSAGAFTEKLPFYQARLTGIVRDFLQWIEGFGITGTSDLVLSYFNPGTALSLAGNTLRGLGGVLTNSLLILLTVIFMLGEASSFSSKLRAVLSDPDRQMPYFATFASNVNRYIAIKTSVSAATGVLIGVFLYVLGIDFPVLWGMVAFLLNYVPNIGSFIAAVPAVLLALIQLGPLYAVVTGVGYVIVNFLMGGGIEPRFLGRGLGLSTLVVFLSLLFWGWILGPVGMFLSVPLTMTAKLALEANPASAWLAHLLGPAVAAPAAVAPTAEGKLAT